LNLKQRRLLLLLLLLLTVAVVVVVVVVVRGGLDLQTGPDYVGRPVSSAVA